jgi:predicted transcriptional regulator
MDYLATKKYMDILREHYNGCSNYRIAQLLGVTKGCVSRWSNGKNGMGDEAAARLADLCGLDGVEVLTELYLERAKSRATRHYFEEVLKRTGTALVLVLPALFFFLATVVDGPVTL